MARIKLEFFNAILYHVGNRDHEIPLRDASSRELKYLKSVHGAENVPTDRIVKVGEREVDEREHYFEIARKYGSREDMTKQEQVVKALEKIFAEDLGDFHGWLDQVTQAEDEQKTAAGRQRAAESAAYAAKREAEIRAEEQAKVRAEIAASMGVSVEDLAALKPAAQPATAPA